MPCLKRQKMALTKTIFSKTKQLTINSLLSLISFMKPINPPLLSSTPSLLTSWPSYRVYCWPKNISNILNCGFLATHCIFSYAIEAQIGILTSRLFTHTLKVWRKPSSLWRPRVDPYLVPTLTCRGKILDTIRKVKGIVSYLISCNLASMSVRTQRKKPLVALMLLLLAMMTLRFIISVMLGKIFHS
jgi:hypothetical protein